MSNVFIILGWISILAPEFTEIKTEYIAHLEVMAVVFFVGAAVMHKIDKLTNLTRGV